MKTEAKKAAPLPPLQAVTANKFFQEKSTLRIAYRSEEDFHMIAAPVNKMVQEERVWDDAWFSSYE